MAQGIVNVPGKDATAGGVAKDTASTVEFSIGVDEGGVYIVTPDEEEGSTTNG